MFAAGFSLRIALLSLTTTWIAVQVRGTIYGTIAVIESFTVMTSESLMQSIFAACLRLPKFWLGVPFFVTSVVYTLNRGSLVLTNDHLGALRYSWIRYPHDSSRESPIEKSNWYCKYEEMRVYSGAALGLLEGA